MGSSNEKKLVGTWQCNEVSPTTGDYVQIIWIIEDTFHKSSYYDSKTERLKKSTEAKSYNFENSIVTTKQGDGKITSGRVEWINDDEFVYTIIEGVKKKLNGHKRTYSRMY